MEKSNVIGNKLKVLLTKLPNKTNYVNADPCMGWLSPPKNGVITQASCLHTCRETFISELKYNFHHSNGGTEEDKRKFVRAGHRKLRSLFTIKHKMSLAKEKLVVQFEEDNVWMEKATRILNVFEDYMNWSKTKICFVESEDMRERKCRSYLVEGSAKWMVSAPLLSLYFLIIRSARQENLYDDFKSLEDCKSLYKKRGLKDHTDVYYVKDSCKHWKYIMDNYDYLFNFRSVCDGLAILNGFQGISSLIALKSNYVIDDYGLKARWFKLRTKINKENKEKKLKEKNGEK